MAITLTDFLTALQADLEALVAGTAIRRVYAEPPDAISMWPAVVTFPISGHARLGSHDDDRMTMHTIAVQVHVPRKDLARDIATMNALVEPVVNCLMASFTRDKAAATFTVLGDPRTANNATNPLRWEVAGSEWDSTETVAILAELDAGMYQEISE